MSAEVNSLFSAQLNRVLKELSRQMGRIRTRLALDPNYRLKTEFTTDLAALLIADKALASIQHKMINANGEAKTRLKPKKKQARLAKRRSSR
jgi:hypothetical protein